MIHLYDNRELLTEDYIRQRREVTKVITRVRRRRGCQCYNWLAINELWGLLKEKGHPAGWPSATKISGFQPASN